MCAGVLGWAPPLQAAVVGDGDHLRLFGFYGDMFNETKDFETVALDVDLKRSNATMNEAERLNISLIPLAMGDLPPPGSSDFARFDARIRPRLPYIAALNLADEPSCAMLGKWATDPVCVNYTKKIETRIAGYKQAYPRVPLWINYVGGSFMELESSGGNWSLIGDLPGFRYIDYISFDCYGPFETCFCRGWHPFDRNAPDGNFNRCTENRSVAQIVDLAKKHMAPHQRIILVPQGFAAPNASVGLVESEVVALAKQYYEYALTEPVVVGLLPFAWGAFSDRPIRTLPSLRHTFTEMGRAIRSGVAQSHHLLKTDDTVGKSSAVGRNAPHQIIPYFNQSYVVVEAENFTIQSGWEARKQGDGNYFTASLNMVFLSRSAYLKAGPEVGSAVATARVNVKTADTYSILVRYEAVYRFNQGFRLKVAQNGVTKLSRVYGLRENLKLWPFANDRSDPTFANCGGGLQRECVWNYGPNENNVWEGVEIMVPLSAGVVDIEISVDEVSNYATSDSPLASRNIDCVLLFPNQTDIWSRIDKWENGGLTLSLDGLLNQHGEVFFKVENVGPTPIALTVPGEFYMSVGYANHLTNAVWNGTFPTKHKDGTVTYGALATGCGVHGDSSANSMVMGPQGIWEAAGGPNCPRIQLSPGATSDWVETGRVLDVFNFGTWNLPRGVPAEYQGCAHPKPGCGPHRPAVISNYSITVGVASDAMIERGGPLGAGSISDGDIEPIGTFTNDNFTLQFLVDASTRATRRIRPQFADLHTLMEALDAQTSQLPERPPIAPQDRHVPFYGTTPPPQGDGGGADFWVGRSGPTDVTAEYLSDLHRFNFMFNFTGRDYDQGALGDEKGAPAFDKMCLAWCWGCNNQYNPVKDPANRAMFKVSLHLPLCQLFSMHNHGRTDRVRVVWREGNESISARLDPVWNFKRIVTFRFHGRRGTSGCHAPR